MPPRCFFAIGTSLSTLTNVETLMTFAPSVLPGALIPLLPPIRRTMSDNSIQRNGKINVAMLWNVLRLRGIDAAINAWWGDYATASKELYASWLDETRHYSPFKVELERPLPGEHYTIVNQTFAQDLTIPGTDWRMQSVSKNANYTVTLADRLIYGDTSGGSRTFTLPAVGDPEPDTGFGFIKAASANNLVVQRAGGDTFWDGSTSKTLTGLNDRLDVYVRDGKWRIIPHG